MSKSMNMLRTRRRDNNVKPNRRDSRLSRLDRRSSRGMIYENEELRLRTININAEIERGQYDIKKLKRENELLKKEIWCLRDEYEKLDKLLKDKEMDFSSSSTTCSTSNSESCSSCTEDASNDDEDDDQVETNQNLQNVQKTNLKNLQSEFDHLSVVAEENSTENSDKTSNRTSLPNDQWDNVIKPDQSYPVHYDSQNKSNTLPAGLPTKNFFSPIKTSKSLENNRADSYQKIYENLMSVPTENTQKSLEELPTFKTKESTDLIVKIDNANFHTNNSTTPKSHSTFSNGGNLEELLQDIETISQDILQITRIDDSETKKPYKSELNVVLMPNPMPLIGFDKYKDIHKSFESVKTKSNEMLSDENPFFFGDLHDFDERYNPDNFDRLKPVAPSLNGSKNNLLEMTSSEQISSENEENLKFKTSQNEEKPEVCQKSPKLSMRRKVSIHFKGKKDKSSDKSKEKKSFLDIKFGSGGDSKHQKTPSLESKKSTTDVEPKTPTSSDSKTGSEKKKPRKSVSVSPDRANNQKQAHHHDEKKRHRKHKKGDRAKSRRGTITSLDRLQLHRERSYSGCTDQSNYDNRYFDDYGAHSERERTNSVSSCETIKTRKLSNISNIPLTGKVPWCACWGNGCV